MGGELKDKGLIDSSKAKVVGVGSFVSVGTLVMIFKFLIAPYLAQVENNEKRLIRIEQKQDKILAGQMQHEGDIIRIMERFEAHKEAHEK